MRPRVGRLAGFTNSRGFECTDDWTVPDRTLPQWEAMGRQKQHDDSVTILECKLWQNDALFRLLAGVPIVEVISSNQRIVEALAEIDPVLIHDDLETHLQWVFDERRDNRDPRPHFDGPKLEVRNPHEDWDRADRAIENLVGIRSSD